MPNKPKLTTEDWAARKAANAERAAEKDRQRSLAFRASLSTDERRAHDKKCNAARSATRKAQYHADRERTREAREAQKAAKRVASAAAAVERKKRRSRERYQQIKANDPEQLARVKEAGRAWQQNNRERTKQWKREHYQKNRERLLAKSSNYAKTHRQQANEAKKRRLKESPECRILYNLRDRLKELLDQSIPLRARTSSLTGCTRQVLRSHLEAKFLPGMGWHNYGTAWHVDHIKPCASFDLTDAEAKHACFHYTNLQPLWDTINVEKSDSVTYDTAYAVSQTPYPS